MKLGCQCLEHALLVGVVYRYNYYLGIKTKAKTTLTYTFNTEPAEKVGPAARCLSHRSLLLVG